MQKRWPAGPSKGGEFAPGGGKTGSGRGSVNLANAKSQTASATSRAGVVKGMNAQTRAVKAINNEAAHSMSSGGAKSKSVGGTSSLAKIVAGTRAPSSKPARFPGSRPAGPKKY